MWSEPNAWGGSEISKTSSMNIKHISDIAGAELRCLFFMVSAFVSIGSTLKYANQLVTSDRNGC